MSWRLAALAPALLLSACVYHIDTAIPDGQSSFDPALIGRWVAESDTADISAGKDGDYRISYTDEDGATVRLEARGGKLGQRTILEITPVLAGDESGDWPVGKLLLVVSVTGDRATTQLINVGAMRAAVARDAALFPHIRRGEDVILTAPTAQLHAALRSYLDRPGTLDEPSTWRRIPPRPPTEHLGNASRRPQPMASATVNGPLQFEVPRARIEDGRGLSCSIHRGIAVVGGAVGGAAAGWFATRMMFWGGEAVGDLERGFMIGGAIIGVGHAFRDPEPHSPIPKRCHRRAGS